MAQPPKWNVMIFLAGNNSLSEECVYSLIENPPDSVVVRDAVLLRAAAAIPGRQSMEELC